MGKIRLVQSSLHFGIYRLLFGIMGNGKRWSVTYTKHIKQKRKVYQDGYLELETSGNKIMLYDDCEKLLGSRTVKTGDNVSSGETICFDSYLVDIGEVDGVCASVTGLNEDCKRIVKENCQQKSKKVTETVGLSNGSQIKHNLLPSDDNKPTLRKNMLSSKLSPSQRIIREFKKNELNKYGSSPVIPDAAESNITEWQVLYTSQLTQKAKKYHDGNLKVVTSGIKANQVMLYDKSGRLLDSKFLRNNEVIASGISLILDGYLVDIGEPEGGDKPPSDPLNTIKVIEKSEWDVLYTSQVTQIAKKYNPGILRLAPCGSCRLKATLSSEDGTALSCKFLKLSEVVKCGIIIQMPNYLVEVGDQRMREPDKIVCKKEKLIPNFKRTIVDAIATKENACTEDKLIPQFKRSIVGVIPSKKSIVDNPSHDGKTEACDLSGGFKSSLKATITTENIDKPLRDSQGILSILKKSMKPECNIQNKISLVDQQNDPKCSDYNHCPMKNLFTGELVEDFDKDSVVTENKQTIVKNLSGKRDPSNDQNYSADDENKGESENTLSQGLETSKIFTKTDQEARTTLVLQDELNAHADGDSIQLMSLEGFSVKVVQQTAEVKIEIPSPSNADMGITPGTSSVNKASHYPVNRKEKRAQMSLSEVEPFSFNLGF